MWTLSGARWRKWRKDYILRKKRINEFKKKKKLRVKKQFLYLEIEDGKVNADLDETAAVIMGA